MGAWKRTLKHLEPLQSLLCIGALQSPFCIGHVYNHCAILCNVHFKGYSTHLPCNSPLRGGCVHPLQLPFIRGNAQPCATPLKGDRAQLHFKGVCAQSQYNYTFRGVACDPHVSPQAVSVVHNTCASPLSVEVARNPLVNPFVTIRVLELLIVTVP